MDRLQQYRKFSRVGAAALCVACLLTGALALAESPRLASLAAELGSSLVVTGTATGLGNKGGKIEIEVLGTFTDMCITPSGKQEPRGQNRFRLEDISSFDDDDIDKNGNLKFDIDDIEVPENGEVSGAPDCPNSNWTQERVVEIDSVVVTVNQGRRRAEGECEFAEGSDEGDCSF